MSTTLDKYKKFLSYAIGSNDPKEIERVYALIDAKYHEIATRRDNEVIPTSTILKWEKLYYAVCNEMKNLK